MLETVMEEKKDSFPTEVRATVEGVKYTIKSEADIGPFSNQAKAQLEKERNEKKAAVKPSGKMILGILALIAGIVFLLSKSAALGIILLAGGAIMTFVDITGMKKKKLAIDTEYEKKTNNALAIIKTLVKEWNTVSSNVANFNSKPRFDVGNVK